MIEVTLIYQDGSTWFAGGFSSLDDAWTWIDQEKTRPYWDSATQVQVVDNTPPDQPPPFFGQ